MQPRPRTPERIGAATRSMPGVSIGTRNALIALAAHPRLRRGEDDHEVRRRGVGDPDLPAVIT